MNLQRLGWTTVVPLALLAAALGAGLIWAYRLWQETHEDDDPVTDQDVLEDLEQAYYAGEIDEAEFRRVRELLGRGQPGAPGRLRVSSRDLWTEPPPSGLEPPPEAGRDAGPEPGQFGENAGDRTP